MVGTIITTIIIAVIVIAVVVWLLNWLYERSTSEQAFVRTGFGGEKVVISGGAFVLPIIHEVTPVSFNLARLEVSAEQENALVTKDRMRMDVSAEFFLRVDQTKQAVASAATTLGKMTSDPERLSAFFEGEFIGAMRAVAARMTMEEVHDDRAGFIVQVRELADKAIAQNGLELRSVAVRSLDQTDLSHFNPANRFDAEGLTNLIGIVEERRKLRNEIEQQSVVAIRERNLEAERETLALDRESQLAKLAQEQEVELKKAEQRALITETQARQEAAANKAKINAEAETEAEKISKRKSTDETELLAREETERARIAAERKTDETRIGREENLRRLEIERQKSIELLELESKIEVLEKAAVEANTRISTGEKLAKAVKAEEGVTTTKEVEKANRDSQVAKIVAVKDSETEKLLATVRAEALRLQHEAENILSEEARTGLLREKLLERIEGIVRETVKPMEKIDGIKIVHLGGEGLGSKGETRSPTDEVMDSVLRYRVQAPLIDELLKDAGVEGANITKSGDIFRSAKDAKSLGLGEKKDEDSS